MYNVLWKSDIFSGIGPGTNLEGSEDPNLVELESKVLFTIHTFVACGSTRCESGIASGKLREHPLP